MSLSPQHCWWVSASYVVKPGGTQGFATTPSHEPHRGQHHNYAKRPAGAAAKMCYASTSRARQNTKICVCVLWCGRGLCRPPSPTATTQLSRQSHLPPTPHEGGHNLLLHRQRPCNTQHHPPSNIRFPPTNSNSTDCPSLSLPVSPLDNRNHQRRAVPLLLLRLLQAQEE